MYSDTLAPTPTQTYLKVGGPELLTSLPVSTKGENIPLARPAVEGKKYDGTPIAIPAPVEKSSSFFACFCHCRKKPTPSTTTEQLTDNRAPERY